MASPLTSALHRLPRVTTSVEEITLKARGRLLFTLIWNKVWIASPSFQTGLVFVIFSAAPIYSLLYSEKPKNAWFKDAHLFEVAFILRMSNLCACLLVLTLRLENKTPSYRILMPVRQRTGWFVLHMLPHWLFITAARYEKRLHPSPSSNEFLHGDSIQGAGVSNGLSLKKRQRLSSNHTLLYEWAAGLERYGTRKAGLGCRWYQRFLQFCDLHTLHQWALFFFFFQPWCLRILFSCDTTADSHPGVSDARHMH